MSTCSKCEGSGSDSCPLAKCDRCSNLRCNNCSTLSFSEHKGVTVEERSPCISYYCIDCINGPRNRSNNENNDITGLQESIVGTMKRGLEEIKLSLNIGDTSMKLTKALDLNIRALSEVTIKMENLSKTINLTNQCETLKCQNIMKIPDNAEHAEITNFRMTLEALRASTEAQQIEILKMKNKLEEMSNQHIKNSLPTGLSLISGSSSSHSASIETVSKPLTSTNESPSKIDKQQLKKQEIVGVRKSYEKMSASKPQTSIFVSRVSLEVNEADLNEYLKNTFGYDHKFKITKVEIESSEYAAFRVRADKALEENLLDPHNWPEGILVKKHF